MYWDQITTKYFREEAMGRIDTAILAMGSVETHGQHCPWGSDNIGPWFFAQNIEEQFSQSVLILPLVPYGHAPDLQPWAGTISVSGDTFRRYVADIGRGVANWGLKNLILLNGHGGNTPALQGAMEDIAAEEIRVVLVNWWMDYSKKILQVTARQGHVGEDERALAPALVHMEDASSNPFMPRYRMQGPKLNDKRWHRATTGDERLASSAEGKQIAAIVQDELTTLLKDLWEDHLFDRTSS